MSINQVPDDVQVLHYGSKWNVVVGPNLRASGWRGGTFVMYSTLTGSIPFEVEKADGNYVSGFLIHPSEFAAPNEVYGATNNYTSMPKRTEQGFVSGAGVVAMACDNGRFGFKVYETQAIGAGAVRDGGPIVYALNQNLYVSENGLLCNDTVVKLAQVGITTPQLLGVVSAVPTIHNDYRVFMDQRL